MIIEILLWVAIIFCFLWIIALMILMLAFFSDTNISKCPRCKTKTDSRGYDDVTCRKCGLEYREELIL